MMNTTLQDRSEATFSEVDLAQPMKHLGDQDIALREAILAQAGFQDSVEIRSELIEKFKLAVPTAPY
jgi:hypothetical protein